MCQWCSLKSASTIIQQLQLEVDALKTELATTKTTLANLQNDRLQNSSLSRTQSYASVTANKKQQQRRPPRSQQSASTSTKLRTSTVATPAVSTREASRAASSSQAGTVATTHDSSNDQHPRVKVEGARKIWATHPHATVKTVENVIARFCNIQGLRIRRKTRRNGTSGRSIWWFVIHADETVLGELDKKWDRVHANLLDSHSLYEAC